MPKGIYLRKNKKSPQELKEKRDKYQKKFREDPKNKEIHKKYMSDYAKNEKRIAYRKNYRLNRKDYEREARQKIKKTVFDAMGGKCVKCGFTDYRAIQIDHINGDGAADKRSGNTNGNGYLIRVLDSFIKREGRYQLLCSNCNWIKRFENNEHSKK